MKPIIAETGYEFAKGPNFNTLNLYLDGRSSSDLLWESLESEIETALKLGAKLSFEIDFGFSEERALLRDPACFFSRGRAVTSFEERVYKPYREQIAAIILYRGSGSFKKTICQDAALNSDFLDWKVEFFEEEEVTDQMFRLFSMEIFMQYLHRLSAPLIDDVPLLALFDLADSMRPSFQAELLSKTFFPYIIPGVKGASIDFNGFGWQGRGSLGYVGHKPLSLIEIETAPPTLGIVIPEMGKVPYDLFDKTINCLVENGIAYRVFPESLMIESWHGLDQILVFSGTVSHEGRRMLQGFNAAAGQVVTVGDSLDLIDEIEVEKFIRSRGI